MGVLKNAKDFARGFVTHISGKFPSSYAEAIGQDICDAVVGIVPVIGDIVPTATKLMRWNEGNGIPEELVPTVRAIVLGDTAVGVVPVVGDAIDIISFSNTYAYRTVEKYMKKHGKKEQKEENETKVEMKNEEKENGTETK